MSHWGSAVAAHYVGLDVYLKTGSQICRTQSPSPPGLFDHDSCRLVGHDKVPLLFVNWQQYPRVYPPGALLYAVPEAMLRLKSGLDFGALNRISVLKYLIFAHLALFVFALCFFEFTPKSQWNGLQIFLYSVLFLFTGYQLIFWSISGIYDAISILFVLISIRLGHSGRSSKAMAALGAAFFFHFRAIWFLPLFVNYAQALIKDIRNGTIRRSDLSWALAGVLLFIATGTLLLTLSPALRGFPVSNPVHLSRWVVAPSTAMIVFATTVFAAVGLALYCRRWEFGAILAWQAIFFLITPETRPWHALFVLPVFAIALMQSRYRTAMVVVAVGYAAVMFPVVF
jgi:hypothetical protein